MQDFLIDKIFVMFGGLVFQQTVGTGDQLCTPSRQFIRLFVWSWLHTEPFTENREKSWLNLLVSQNNSKYGDYVYSIYPIEL